MRKRGLLVTLPLLTDGAGELSYVGTKGIDDVLRRSLLYWDAFDIPDSNVVSIGSTPPMEELRNLGVLTRSMATASGLISDIAAAMPQMHAFILNERELREPGGWFIAETGNMLSSVWTGAWGSKARTAAVELHNLLPVPADDVPFAEILQYKEKRKSELEAMRAVMDEIYQRVVNSPDTAFTMQSEKDRIEKVVLDLNQSMLERFRTTVRSIRSEVSLTDLVAAGAETYMATHTGAFLPLFTGLKVLSAIKLTMGGGSLPKPLGHRKGPFAYLYGAMDAKIIPRNRNPTKKRK